MMRRRSLYGVKLGRFGWFHAPDVRQGELWSLGIRQKDRWTILRRCGVKV
jgi:hypothetical protein